ncbi:MAG: hypothetical protein ABSG53_09985 [Thermoguttaceae bacterium]|jgi:hypothetical protein
MGSILDKKFNKVWQSLKKNAGVKSSPWFKKADVTVSTKVGAYQKALAKAQSGLVEDLLKLGKALRDLEEAFVTFVDGKGLGQIRDSDMNKGEKAALVAEINHCKADVQHERNLFDSRLKSALAAADNDLKTLESIEDSKKKELWKGFGIDL